MYNYISKTFYAGIFMTKKYSLRFFIGLSICWVGIIFANSVLPADVSKSLSNIPARLLTNILNSFSIDIHLVNMNALVRKIAHAFEFSVEAILLSILFTSFSKFKDFFIYVLFLGLFTASIDEYIQLFSKGRGSEVSDILIDFAGTILGICIFLIFKGIFNLIKKFKVRTF